MRSLVLTVVCVVLASAVTAGAEAVKLPTTRLADANLVLSPASIQPDSPDRPIVYYRAFGAELILPTRKLVWEAETSQELRVAKAAVALRPTAEGLEANAPGAGKWTLKSQRLGTTEVGLNFAGSDYFMAFPRVFRADGKTVAFYRPATARCGQIAGQRITFYDDSLDGTYAPGTDGVCVGDTGLVSVFAPIGELIGTPKGVWRIDELAADGSSATFSAFDGPSGKLAIMVAPAGLECRLALASEDGTCSTALLAGSEPVALAAGKYKLLFGALYNPSAGRAAAMLSAGSISVNIEAGKTTTLAIGAAMRGELETAEEAFNCSFGRALAVDLSAVEQACAGGDFAKATALLGDANKSYPAGGPNYQASQAWFDELDQRLKLESTSEATALRDAENKTLDLIRKNELAGAKQALPAVEEALKKIPAAFQASPAFLVHKARCQALARQAAERRPGLAVTYYGHKFSSVTGRDFADKVSWETDPRGLERSQFFCVRYEGFLIAPQEGMYELSMESDEGARLFLDGEQVIDHFRPHTLAEKTTAIKLSPGSHALRIEYFQHMGPATLHFRWTPPGGRRTIVPPWALETSRTPSTLPAPVIND